MVRVHIKPKWENTRLADIRALDVKGWLDKDFKGGGAASKKRAKGVISRMLDLAMLWKLTPIIERNPMQLVKVKGSTKQQKPLIILTMEQFIALVRELRQLGLVKQVLPMPHDLIIFLVGNLGPRVSEVVAFKWSDIDEAESTITIQRVFTHSRLKPYPKTDKS